MDRAYYNEYYFLERNHWWFVVRSKIIDDRISSIVPAGTELSILNIGVATGATNNILKKYGRVTSVEYDKECALFTFEESGEQIIAASVQDLPFRSDSFDLVCAFDVIEHVENDERAVSEMQRVCRKRGRIFITVPAFMILWSHHDVVNQHKRRYKINEIESLFEKPRSCGKELYKTYFNTILFPFILCFRVLSKFIPESMIRKGAGSDFTIVSNESIINKILFQVFSLERKLLRYLTFKFGSSILYAWGKIE